MCDFKPGDEVVYIGYAGIPVREDHVFFGDRNGDVLTVKVVAPWKNTDIIALVLNERPNRWVDSRCWRKVQRRDLTAWLATENTIEGPVRPRKRERVS